MSMVNLFVVLLAASTALSYRLPTIYSPSSYNISLTVPEDVFTSENGTGYTGTVQILFTVSENVSEVCLHVSPSYLAISNTSNSLINTNGSDVINVTGVSIDNTTEIANFTLSSLLTVNQTYLLTIDFNGTLSTSDGYGFYKSSYNDSSNTTQYLATTQMEPTFARRAFPCFDEPKYKAIFIISLTHPNGLNVLSNMNALNVAENTTTSQTVTTFNPTPIMSTYLVAFIVSNFTCDSTNDLEGSLLNQVCSRSETASTRALALEAGPKIVDSFNTYLNINYSSNINKLDQVAIPDFTSGAMENWGLITYRERALLYDANETSNSYQQYTLTVVAHELAHQWFGNLVTCKWWSEIFLNEGFATFFEFFLTHEVYPDLEADKQFVTKALHYAMDDEVDETEALRTNATTQSEISARFSTISYDKGGSILRMVEHILGTDAWKIGLNRYLSTYAHSSAEPEDLWDILGNNTNRTLPANLSAVMESWIDSPGFPVVNVSLNGSQLTLTQARFVFSNSTATNVSWYIPVTYTTSENASNFFNTTPVAWITPTSNLSLNVSSSISWIVVNNLHTGYYRVNYDSSLWSKLVTALAQSNFSGIPEISRAQIVSDGFNLARGGYISYSQLFSVIEFLTNETSYHVWYSALSGFEYLLKRTGLNSTLGAAIASHISNLTAPVLETVPLTVVDSSNHIYTLHQVLVQGWACKLGGSNCTTHALSLFAGYKNTSTRPDKNLRSIAYCYGLKNSSDIATDWSFLWNKFLNTSLSTEQVTILAALGCPSNETILTEYLSKTLTDDSGIRSQDYASVFSAVYSGSSLGVDVALDFYISNYDAILVRDTRVNGAGRIIKAIAEQITTEAQIAKLQTFANSSVVNGTMVQSAADALSTAQSNLQWLSTYQSSLSSYYGLDTTTTTTAPATTPTTTTTTTTTESTSTTDSSAYQFCLSLSLLLLGLVITKL
uniref:Aminopeptidase n=1 Tax=Dendroctonus ponderosae TaxID=77166 RepID=A0AAR5PQZ4_DENPD